MKRLAFLLAAVVLFTPACDDDDPVDPSVLLPLRFTADMTAANEVPPVTNADSSATGRMTLTINVTKDSSNNVTAVSSSEFVVNMTGFPAGTVLTGAHIHAAPAGQNAGVLINTGLAVGEIPVTSGAASFTKSASLPQLRSSRRRTWSTTRPASTSTCTRNSIWAVPSAPNWCGCNKPIGGSGIRL